ncbi:PAS domain-containing sensor histidine kinase [uncultured Rhodoblastus sp.]|uniref:sensor histidine kinase n=1 Tax=uncultured Rhodoblastus sp. TaxID=543037 RepID=UPI0025ED8A28|nr:PAS domain-containing sensor histidine kinase [uncultured Rhodoblastus sp.]
MVDETANRPPRPDVTAALAEPTFASLARAGAPIVVADGDPARVIYANGAALALFAAAGCEDLSHRLFASDEPGALRLAHLARIVLPGAAARLERLSLRFDLLSETVTFLCRRTPGANPLFVLAGLGLRAGQPRARIPLATEAPRGAMAQESGQESEHESEQELGHASAPEAVAPPAPVAGTESPLAEDGLAPLRDDLARRFPGLPPSRFLWRTDASNIVTEVTPPLAELVGPGCAALIGRDLVAAAEALGLDPRGELTQALRGRSTFSRIEVDWPVENAAAAAPVTLGALPAFGRGHDFEGWRGFGVIHLDRLHAAPLIDPPFADTRSFDEALPAAPPQLASASPEFSGVVVPLRPFFQPQVQAPPPPALARDNDADSVLVALAPHERNAFREIARTLGARSEFGARSDFGVRNDFGARGEAGGNFGAPSEPGRDLGEPPLPPSFGAGNGLDADGLDVLPFGLLVLRDGEAVFASRPLLDWLGFADLAAFEEAGGLHAVCRNALPPRFERQAPAPERRAVSLRSIEGDSFVVDAQRGQLNWEGAPAEFWAMTRPSSAALEQRVGVLEAALRQREDEAEETLAILDTAADGFVLINADGAILGLNRSAETLFGYGRNQIAGENFTLLLASDSQPAALEYFARLKAGQHESGRQMIGLHQHGREVLGRPRLGGTIPLHLAIGRLGRGADGKFCAVLRDLSRWKQAEAAIEEARAHAERGSQAKSEFLAKVSHEIRTPLNAILGFAEVIMEERFGPVGNERYREYLKDIHASGVHVMSLVNDLLDLSKIESGGLDLTFCAVDANRVVAECVALIQPQANRDKVITRLALAARLPAVWVDERSLRQIVLNLLANAVRYNEPGGQVIVSTACHASGQAVLRVKDTGIGMSESELQKAIEPFRQIDPSRGGGAGLGLPLTKALAEANRASFAIRSRKGEGTLVEIAFPLAPAESVADKAG